MRRVVCALLLMLMSGSALAEQVLVSFGNTQSATRLVLTFDTLPKWSSTQSERGLSLSFDSGTYGLDPADTAGAASNPRIADLKSDDTGQQILLELACDCATDVYPFGSGSLVIEVRDALSPSPVEQNQTAAPKQPPAPTGTVSEANRISSFDTPNTSNAPEPLMAPSARKLETKDASPLPWPSQGAPLETSGLFGLAFRSETESQAVELLSRELSRAASQGLIAPEDVPQPTTRDRTTAANSPGLGKRSNIKIITSLDRATSTDHGQHPPTHDGGLCFPDSEVDLAAWGDTTDISNIGQLRHTAYGENGDVTPDGAKNLARYYIALGFGAEAAAAARFMKEGDQKALILAMAEIVDHGSSDSDIMDGQLFCRGQIALWAALARPIEQSVPPESTDIILSTFSALSPHHRAHLGPVLAERLRAVGMEDEARNAVNSVARGGLQSNESELVTARLELGGTRPDRARDTLVEISNGTDLTAAEALLELLEDAERRGMAPNPAWVEDAPSLARATEGTEVAEVLNLAGLRGRIALGQFDELRISLAEDTPGLDAQSRDVLARMAIVAAARDAEDEEFLRSEIGLLKLMEIADMANSDRFEVAHRLAKIGLPSRAVPYLMDDPVSKGDVQTLAQVLIATDQTDRAVAFLSKRDDQEASLQLGHVLSRAGENEMAIQAFEDAGSIENAAQSALRAGNWDWIADREIAGASGALSDAARTLSTPAPELGAETDDTDEPANGRLITHSQELRQFAETLLSETNLSTSDPAFTN